MLRTQLLNFKGDESLSGLQHALRKTCGAHICEVTKCCWGMFFVYHSPICGEFEAHCRFKFDDMHFLLPIYLPILFQNYWCNSVVTSLLLLAFTHAYKPYMCISTSGPYLLRLGNRWRIWLASNMLPLSYCPWRWNWLSNYSIGLLAYVFMQLNLLLSCFLWIGILERFLYMLLTWLPYLDVIHTSCLLSHIKGFPPHTAPAGYACPACSTSVCLYSSKFSKALPSVCNIDVKNWNIESIEKFQILHLMVVFYHCLMGVNKRFTFCCLLCIVTYKMELCILHGPEWP